MSLQTYTIELKIDTADEGHEAMAAVVKQYACDLRASAMLLSAQKRVLIMARSQDAFYDEKEIDLLTPSGNLHGEL